MRILAIVLTTAFTLASATAWACPMHTAQEHQTLASGSSDSNSTPIPPREEGSNG